MKQFTLFLLLIMGNMSFAQQAASNEDPIFEEVEKVAYYRLGYEKFYELIEDHMVCQREKIRAKKGEILLRFVVEKNGTVSQPEILKSDRPNCDDSILAAVKNTKGWIPAKINNRPVRSYVTLPITLQKVK